MAMEINEVTMAVKTAQWVVVLSTQCGSRATWCPYGVFRRQWWRRQKTQSWAYKVNQAWADETTYLEGVRCAAAQKSLWTLCLLYCWTRHQCGRWKIQHTSKANNKVTRKLVFYANQTNEDCIWTEDLPEFLDQVPLSPLLLLYKWRFLTSQPCSVSKSKISVVLQLLILKNQHVSILKT